MLERLSILIVEDNQFVRGMMIEILRALKVGKIISAADGGEAIGMLRQISKNPAASSVLAIDLVIADYLMSPINGAMLLRWARNHDDSPDRFMHFMMISGVADGERVREARDFGVTEFLAKPFSVKSFADHILALIDQPRPFIFNKDYFGPDRRRQARAFHGDERRLAKDEEIETLYATSRLKQVNNKAKAFRFILPNRIKEKIQGIGRGGPLKIDSDLLSAAESQLDRMADDYTDWVRGAVTQLWEAHGKAVLEDNTRGRLQWLAAIKRIAHELRGQGSTFGYPLITVFARSLYECTNELTEVGDHLLDFVKSHIEGITAVMRDKVKGLGGALGQELVASLEHAREKLSRDTRP